MMAPGSYKPTSNKPSHDAQPSIEGRGRIEDLIVNYANQEALPRIGDRYVSYALTLYILTGL